MPGTGPLRSIDSAIEAALAERRIVGAVVLAAQDGKLVYRRAAGFADREQARPMRENDLFRLASITKPIVTAAVMKFVERGELPLDAPVARWLPEFRPALPDGSVPDITIRHLLTHTAGLSYSFLQFPNGTYHRHAVSDGMDQPGLPIDDNLRRIAAAGLAFPPGAQWHYSVALDVLGAVLERIETRSLDDIVKHHVTSPLGLDSLGFVLSTGQREHLVVPYVKAEPEPVRMDEGGHIVKFDPESPLARLAGIRLVPNRIHDASSFHSGGAGMNGTAIDVLNFLESIRQGGESVVSERAAGSMMSNQTGELPIPMRGPGWGFGFGGAVLLDAKAADTPQTNGTWTWGGVWGHNWFVDPARKLTVVILTNTSLEGMNGQFPRDVRDAVYRDLG